MYDIELDLIAELDEINNLEGPYLELVTNVSSYKITIKKTYIKNLVIIDGKVCDFNRSEGYFFKDKKIILLIGNEIYFGE